MGTRLVVGGEGWGGVSAPTLILVCLEGLGDEVAGDHEEGEHEEGSLLQRTPS